MADEPQVDDVEAPVTPDTPDEVEQSGPQPTGPGTPAEEQPVDWEQRYKDLQSSYTQTSQEAAQLREAQEQAEAEQAIVEALSDPEQQEQTFAYLVQELGQEEATAWAEAHGFEVELDEGEQGQEFRDPRVDQLLAERQAERQNRSAEQIEKGMEDTLDKCLQEKNLKREDLGEGVSKLLLDAAIMSDIDSERADADAAVQRVFGQWYAADQARLKAYRQSKRDQPSQPVPGSSGTPNPSLGDRDERLARANAVAEEALIQP